MEQPVHTVVQAEATRRPNLRPAVASDIKQFLKNSGNLMIANTPKTLAALLLTASLSLPALAQNDDETLPRTEPLSWMDQNQSAQQRQYVDELARLNFGRPVRGDKSDIRLLQRIINEELIPKDEAENLQAMGPVLGDVYVAEHGLEWRTYVDERGRSRAVCVGQSTNCIFPITMLSRRVAAGLKPDVEMVFNKGLETIAPYMPKRPFDGQPRP